MRPAIVIVYPLLLALVGASHLTNAIRHSARERSLQTKKSPKLCTDNPANLISGSNAVSSSSSSSPHKCKRRKSLSLTFFTSAPSPSWWLPAAPKSKLKMSAKIKKGSKDKKSPKSFDSKKKKSSKSSSVPTIAPFTNKSTTAPVPLPVTNVPIAAVPMPAAPVATPNTTTAPVATPKVTSAPMVTTVVDTTSAPTPLSPKSKKKNKEDKKFKSKGKNDNKGKKDSKKNHLGKKTSPVQRPVTMPTPSIVQPTGTLPVPTAVQPTGTPSAPKAVQPTVTIPALPAPTAAQPTVTIPALPAPTAAQPTGIPALPAPTTVQPIGIPSAPTAAQPTVTIPALPAPTAAQPTGTLPVPTAAQPTGSHAPIGKSPLPNSTPMATFTTTAPAAQSPVASPISSPTNATNVTKSYDRSTSSALTPFQVTYNIHGTGTNPTSEQIYAAVNITVAYINEYFLKMFEVNSLVTYVSLKGSLTAISPDFTEISYNATALFARDSMFVPSMQDLDMLLVTAFQQPGVQTLLVMLQQLPSDNSYSQTLQASYKPAAIPTTGTSSSRNTGAIAGITSAFLVTFFVAGVVVAYRGGAFGWNKKYTKARELNKMPEHFNVTQTYSSSVDSQSTFHEDDEGYQSRILDEDIEIKFEYPEKSSCETPAYDPLFQSPFSLLRDEERRRENV